MVRRFPWFWALLSLALLGGATWATARIWTTGALWQFALLWISAIFTIGAGFWSRWRLSGEAQPLSLPNHITAIVLFATIFGGIDFGVVYGEAVWRPLTAAGGILYLLFGWTADWTVIAPTPLWQRPARQLGYFGLTLLGMALIPFIEAYSAMLFFMAAELLSPRIYEQSRSSGPSRNGESKVNSL